ncbi:MAG: hypothetical protein V3V41_05270 [Candidatus Heimdallarchaeota archaeon]
MFEYLKKANFEKEMQKLESLPKGSEEWFIQHMKLTLSFGSGVRLTKKGYDYGIKIAEKIDNGEELTREEIMRFGFIASQMTLMENPDKIQFVNNIYQKMLDKYKPDLTYLQELVQYQMVKEELMEENPDYMQTMAIMFTTDFLQEGSPVRKMVDENELPPAFNSLKKCPYCALGFEQVETLMIHVQNNHPKEMGKN